MRRRGRAVALTLSVALGVALGAGCKGKAKSDAAPGANRPPLMTAMERKRGEDACTTYVQALCACAAAKPTDAKLAEQCALKQAKPEALQLLLAVDDDPKATDDSRLRAQIEARKLIAKCVMEHASLPSLGCR